MLPFGVTTPATVPQMSEIPEGLTNNPVHTVVPVQAIEAQMGNRVTLPLILNFGTWW